MEDRDSQRPTPSDEVHEMATLRQQLAAFEVENERLRRDQEQAEAQIRMLNDTLADRVAQLRLLTGELMRAEENERRRLARLLHDDLQQTLASASLHLSLAARSNEPAVRRAVQSVRELIDAAIGSSRALTAELSPAILREAGLVPALRWLGRWMQERYSLTVAVQIEETLAEGELSDELALLLFNGVRELLMNVVQHAGVHEAALRLGRQGGLFVISVEDAGRGVEVDAQGYPTGEGQGLGLLRLRQRLAMFNGRLDVVSAPHHGVRVTMLVPLAEEIVAFAPAPETAIEPAASAAAEPCDPRGGEQGVIRILLVDDHPSVREVMAGLLGGQPDFRLIGEAEDGDMAVKLVRELAPDVVLMDLVIPRLDGIEATRRILAERPHTCVIGLSMFDDAEKEALMRRAGARGYVAKGGPPEALFQTIRACVKPG